MSHQTFTPGAQASAAHTPFFMEGHASPSGSFPLFIKHGEPASSGINLFIKHGEPANSGINLHTHGHTSANGLCTLFIKNGTLTTATIDLHTHGVAEGSGTPYAIMPLVVAEGMTTTGINDNITLFIKQRLIPSGIMTLYTAGGTGGTRKTNTIPLFFQQGAGPYESFNLYTKGKGRSDTHGQYFLSNSNDGFYCSDNSITLMIARDYEATTSTTKLFVEGQQTRSLTSVMPLNILTPSGVPSANLPLALNAGIPSGTLELYTRGY